VPRERGGRPLIIGESPSRAGDRYYQFPLSGNPAKWLCGLAGIEIPAGEAAYWSLVEHFDTANALKRFPRDGWDIESAFERVCEIVQPYDVVVLMGKRAQNSYPAKNVVYAPLFEWNWDPWGYGPKGEPRQVAAIPHSSGLNRLNNVEENRVRTGEVLREALERAKK
jgi:hypothetical protein